MSFCDLLGRQRPRRGEAALWLAAWRVAGAAVQFAQGFEDVVDADGRLQSFRRPQRRT